MSRTATLTTTPTWNRSSKLKVRGSASVELRNLPQCHPAHFIEEVYNSKRLHSALGYLPPIESTDRNGRSGLPQFSMKSLQSAGRSPPLCKRTAKGPRGWSTRRSRNRYRQRRNCHLKQCGRVCGKHRVARLRRQAGIEARRKCNFDWAHKPRNTTARTTQSFTLTFQSRSSRSDLADRCNFYPDPLGVVVPGGSDRLVYSSGRRLVYEGAAEPGAGQ
jgi:hypothetical protein